MGQVRVGAYHGLENVVWSISIEALTKLSGNVDLFERLLLHFIV